jgi:hypothetical protein
MIKDMDSQIRDIKDSIAAADKLRTRAEVQKEQMREAVKRIVGQLQDDFKVSSLDEAKNLRDMLRSRVDDKLAEVESSLASFRES